MLYKCKKYGHEYRSQVGTPDCEECVKESRKHKIILEENNNIAIEDVKSGYSKIFSYTVNKSCYESIPCKHDITVMLDDGRIVYLSCVSERYARRYVNKTIKFH
jgi:hypothetical protein